MYIITFFTVAVKNAKEEMKWHSPSRPNSRPGYFCYDPRNKDRVCGRYGRLNFVMDMSRSKSANLTRRNVTKIARKDTLASKD